MDDDRCAECDCENGGADCTWISRPRKSAEVLLLEARAEIARLTEALELIYDMGIPDQPASYSGEELSWAQRHVADMRRIAFRATKPRTEGV